MQSQDDDTNKELIVNKSYKIKVMILFYINHFLLIIFCYLVW